MGYGSKGGWYETYIHLYDQHQILLHDFNRQSGWDLDTWIHLYHHYYYDKLCDCERKSVWYQEAYVYVSLNPQTLQYFNNLEYHCHYNRGRNNGWYLYTNIQDFHHQSS